MYTTNTTISGFTLIELMIAIFIIAGLASIAIPIYHQNVETSRTTECANEVASIRLGMEEDFLINNRYIGGTINGQANILTLDANLGPSYSPSLKAAGGDTFPPNCFYVVVVPGIAAAPGGPAPGYTITAFGINQLADMQSRQPYIVRQSGP